MSCRSLSETRYNTKSETLLEGVRARDMSYSILVESTHRRPELARGETVP